MKGIELAASMHQSSLRTTKCNGLPAASTAATAASLTVARRRVSVHSSTSLWAAATIWS